MPQKYIVKAAETADRDLVAIDDYVFSDSPQNAQSLIAELHSAIDSLDVFPYRCKTFEENDDPSKIVYLMSGRPFGIYYRVVESAQLVEILTVRHGARDRPPRFFR